MGRIWIFNLIVLAVQAATFHISYFASGNLAIAGSSTLGASLLLVVVGGIWKSVRFMHIASLGVLGVFCFCIWFATGGDILRGISGAAIVLVTARIPAIDARRDDRLLVDAEPDGGAPISFNPHPWTLYYLLLLPLGVGVVIGGIAAGMYHRHIKHHGITIR